MKPWARKAILVTAYAYLSIAAVVMLFGYAAIWYFEGFGRLMVVLSPFNIVNYIAVVLTFAPGLLLLLWADRTN